MSKFKVGDVVKRVGSNNGWEGATVGQVATVTSLDDEGNPYVKYEGCMDTFVPNGGELWYVDNAEISLPAHGFTTEQLEFLSSHFNITVEDIQKEQKKTIRVSDGIVGIGDKVWEKCSGGPMQITVDDSHTDSILDCPELYCIEIPMYTLVAKYY